MCDGEISFCRLIFLIYYAISFNSRSIWIQILQLKAIICLELEITLRGFFLYPYFHASPYIYFDIYVGLAFQTIFVPSLSLILHNFCVYIAFSKVILIHNSTQIQKIYHVRKYINKIKYQQNNADIFFIIKTCFMFYHS